MKKVLVTLICVMLLCGCSCKEELSGIADCVNSFNSNEYYYLSIIANQEEIDNKEEYALQLIEKVKNNDFKTIMFSYDVGGYPIGLEMNVYLTEEDKKNGDLFMCVRFTQENSVNGYNIVDDYDKFTLEIS